MEAQALILGIVVLPILCLVINGLLFPIVFIIRAASNDALKYKALWLILMVFIWPLPQHIYGIFIEKSKFWNRFCILFTVVAIVLFATGFFLIDHYYGQLDNQVLQVRQELLKGKIQSDAEIMQGAAASLEILAQEMKETETADLPRMRLLSGFYEKFRDAYKDDGYLAAEEYQEWSVLFNNRNLIDGQKL